MVSNDFATLKAEEKNWKGIIDVKFYTNPDQATTSPDTKK